MNHRFSRRYDPPVEIDRAVTDSDYRIVLDGPSERITISLDDKGSSRSYFEAYSLKSIAGAVGQKLFELREVFASADRRPRNPNYPIDTHGGSMSYHAIELVMSDGVVTLDWRNQSNGYYDGDVLISHETYLFPEPDELEDYYYYDYDPDYGNFYYDVYNSGYDPEAE